MVARKLYLFILLSLFVTLFITFSYADWGRWGTGEDEDGIAICDATGNQSQPIIISDLVYGAIIVWPDQRSGANIYAQRININGVVQWTNDGVAICTATDDQSDIDATTDAAGGGIVVWNDYRDGEDDPNIYVQRIDSTGQTQWTTNGICIDTTLYASAYSNPAIAPDSVGGAIIAWNKQNNIYAQRINSSGVIRWTDGGIKICDASQIQTLPCIVSDGSGGVIIGWMDWRDTSSADVYAQKIDSSGAVQWTSNGVAIYDSSYNASYLKIISDRNEGAIITWIDSRGGASEIWAQHVDSGGNISWARNGESIDSITGINYDATIDSLGGAIVAYPKYDETTGTDIHAARIDVNGKRRWTTNVTPKSSTQYSPSVCADSAGGAIISWEDFAQSQPDYAQDIYCQRLDRDGNLQWSASGIIACNASSAQSHSRIIFNGDWDAIITWQDNRNSNYDIYAQRIEAPIPSCSLTYAYSDTTTDYIYGSFMIGCPEGDWDSLFVYIDFDDEDMLRDIALDEVTLDKPDTLFTFWNVGPIEADFDATLGNGYTTKITHINFSHSSDTGRICNSLDIPARFIRFSEVPIDSLIAFLEKSPDRNGDSIVNLSDLSLLADTYWKYYSQDSFDCWFDFTGDTCVNLSDYCYFGLHYHHEYDPPQQFRAPMEEITSNIIAQFDASSFKDGSQSKHLITIYLENIIGNKLLFMGLDFNRSILAFEKWIPNPSFKDRSAVAQISNNRGDWLATAAFKLDYYSTNNIELGTLEFIVKDNSATIDENDIWINFADVLEENGNETRIQGYQYHQESDTPTLTTRLSGNYPNPFNPSTIIEYSISKDTHVNLSIYNVNGQLVRILVNEFQKKKHYKHVWDGRNNRGITVASGVYFLNMKTASYTMTKKLVILR